ncbi:MAG: helix-turn-helix domain-containing protein [Oscillospiraceae bacterium]|nr:helix-turn-helix domain-containing protein [Oscillospiraceae bacterium]
MSNKLTTKEIFGIRLRDLRRQNGYTIEQFATKIGVAKSTIGYYENENRMPDIEVLSRICDEFNVPADYMLGRTNTAAVKGKKKDVCELTGLSDAAADFLFGLVKHQRYGIIDKLNYLLEDFANDYNEDYDMQGNKNLEDTSSILNAIFGYMEKYSRYENALGFMEIEDIARQQRAETVYRELLIRRIIDAVKVGTEEYKEQHKPWE